MKIQKCYPVNVPIRWSQSSQMISKCRKIQGVSQGLPCMMCRNRSGNKRSRSLRQRTELLRHSFPNSSARCTNTMGKKALLWYKEWKTFADESCKASRNEWTQQVQSIAQHRLSSAKKSEHSSDTDFDTRRFWKEKKSSKHRPAQTCTNALSWCIRTTCLWSMLFTWPKCNQVACHSNWFSVHLHLVLLHHSCWFVTGIGSLDCIGFTAYMCSNKKVDVYHSPSPLFTVALFP